MFVIFKWLLWLCMPFTWMLLVFWLAPFFLWRKQCYKMAFLSLLCGMFFTALSLPFVSDSIGYSLEKKFPPQHLNQIPKADAILLLGGSVLSLKEDIPYPECDTAVDRVVMAARLYHAGKAPIIIPSGEQSYYAEKPLLEAMKVPATAIVCESKARDTAENAKLTLEMLEKRGCKSALLISSSWHLTRAQMLYEGSTIIITPVGCDYESTIALKESGVRPLWMKVPSPKALHNSCRYLKEYLGILFYSLKGSAFPSKK